MFEKDIEKKLKAEEEKKVLGSIAFSNLSEEARKKAVEKGIGAMGKKYSDAPKTPEKKTPNRMAMDRSKRRPGR